MFALEELLWQDFAACRKVENADALFFPEWNEYGRLNEARELCRGCPVRRECLDYALKYKVSGIWAGTTEKDRQRVRALTGVIPIRVQMD